MMANSGKVLVTGATGNVGSGLVQALSDSGVAVRAQVHDHSKAQDLKEQGVEVVVADYDKPETLPDAFHGVGKAFLLTGANPNAAKQASNLIAAAKQADNPHLVRLSALIPEPALETKLGRLHAETEEEIKASGLPYTILRPSFFMQNTMAAAQTVASDGMIYMPFKDARLGMIDLRDVVAATVAVLTGEGHEGKTYEMTGPASISFHDVAAALSNALDKEVQYVSVPLEAAKESMLDMGFPSWVVDAYAELYDNFSQGGGDRTTDTVARLTGQTPRSYEQFARDFTAVFSGGS